MTSIYYSNFTLSSVTDRGFTSHEQLQNFGLINMNGRVYDPMTLGFLSPDPFIQNPSNSQNYNRFSYVLNNPLKYVDPSGHVALNPWYETLINGMRFFKEYPEMGETFKDKNDNLWKLKKDMKFSDKNGNVFLRMIGDGLYVEIAKYQEYQEKLQQYNSQFENADFGFIAGAGVFRVEGEGGGSKNNTTNTTGSSGNPVQTVSDVNNYFSIVISAVDQVLKNTKFGSNIAYAISGNSNVVSAVNNGLKFAPYAGLFVTIYTGSLLSTEKNPATNQPYQSWFETGTDIGANLGIIYIGTQFGGWWGAGAAAVYLLDKAAFKAYIEECKKGTYEGIPKYRR